MVICLDQRNGTGCGTKNQDKAQFCTQCGKRLQFALNLRDPGAIVGNYRVLRVIGYGNFGAVYEAEPLAGGAPIALKETFEPSELRGLQREFDLLRHLQHANLPRYDAVFEFQGNGYLVMEYVPGQNLDDILQKQSRPLAEGQVLGYALQLCTALSYLHAQQPLLLHRDIKPANIRLTPEGLIKLVDFGLIKQGGQQTRATIRGFGTPAYAPLEQYGRANEQTDPRSDIYSLGATLYHLLTNQEPVASPSRIAASRDALLSLRSINPAISVRVDAAILQAMELRQDDRFSTAAAFRAALIGTQPVLPPKPGASQSVSAKPPVAATPQRANVSVPPVAPVTPSVQSSTSLRRRWGIVIGVVALTAIMLLLVLLPRSTRQPTLAAPNQPPTVVSSGLAGIANINEPPTTVPELRVATPAEASISTTESASSVQAPPVNNTETEAASDVQAPPMSNTEMVNGLPVADASNLRAVQLDSSVNLPTELLVSVRQPDKTWRVALALPHQDRLIYIETGGNALQPVLSPDEQKLAFTDSREGSDAIYVLEMSNGSIRRVTPLDTDAELPDWSPDGQSLVYTAMPHGNKKAESHNYIVDVASGSVRQLSDHHGGWVCWSRANEIIFTGWAGKSFDLFRINPDGSDITNLTNSDDTDEDIPACSSDGTRIVFVRSPRGKLDQRQVFVMQRNGGNMQQLTNMEGPNSNPVWSPDDHTIAFAHQPAQDAWQPWLTPSQGGTAQQLGTNDDRVWFMRWGRK